MVWIFRERKDSRDSSINPGRCTLKFIAGRTGDDAYVRAYSLAATPLLYYSLFRQTVDIKSLGGGMWNVDVNYGPLEPPTSVGEYSYQFDTTGNVAKRTNFLGTPTSYAREGETAPDHKGAINVSDNGVEGVDVVVPGFKWTETHTFHATVANWSYSQILKALTGRVNAATFRGFAAKQVLFHGATGGASNREPGQVVLTYSFEQQDDVKDLDVGDVKGVNKTGFQYAWTEYQREDDATASKTVHRPLAVHVGDVYYTADFDLLLIGR